MSNNSIWSIDRTLSGDTTPGQSGFGGKAMKGYTLFLKGPALQVLYHLNVWCHTQDTPKRIRAPLQRLRLCIQLLQPTRLEYYWVLLITKLYCTGIL